MLAEGSTEAAKQMEFVLVDAAGGDSGQSGKYKDLSAAIKKKEISDPLELGKTILDKVGLLNKGAIIYNLLLKDFNLIAVSTFLVYNGKSAFKIHPK